MSQFTPTRWSKIPNPDLSGWGDFVSPCYNPQGKYGNCPPKLLGILDDKRIPIRDRIWAFCNCILVPDNVKRLFAVRCVRETPMADGRFVEDLLDDRLKVFNVAEKHAHGEAGYMQLSAAWAAAREALASEASARVEAVSYAARVAWETRYSAWAAFEAAWMARVTARVAWDAALTARVTARAAARAWETRDDTPEMQLEIAKSFFAE